MLKVLVVLGVLLSTYLFIPKDKSQELGNQQDLVLAESEETINSYKVNDAVQANWFLVDDASSVNLFSNISDQLTSDEFININNCNRLTSGGFYKKEGHIGYFSTDNAKLSNEIGSPVINGFLHIGEDGDVLISSKLIPENRIVLQTGPIFYLDKPLNLRKTFDESRRIIAITNENPKEIIFVTLYNPNSINMGPALSEVPQIIQALADVNSWKVKGAINLDGGLHSTFIDGDIKLKESLFAGSFFCIK